MTDWVEPSLPGVEGEPGTVADHRPDVYLEGETVIVRASSLGRCTRSLIAQGLGMLGSAPPAKLVGKWEESARLESDVLAAGKKAIEAAERIKYKHLPPKDPNGAGGVTNLRPGVGVKEGQWELNWPIGRATARGGLDELVSIYERAAGGYVGKAFIEAKAFGDSLWDLWVRRGWEAFPHYATQFSTYGHGTGLPGWMVVAHKVDGEITDVDIRWVPLDEMPVGKGTLMVRVNSIAGAVLREELPEECDQNDWPCPVWYLHGEREEDLVEIDDEDTINLVHRYFALKERMKADEGEMEVLRGLMFESGLEIGVKYAVGGVRVLLSAAEVKEATRVVKGHTRRTIKVEAL